MDFQEKSYPLASDLFLVAMVQRTVPCWTSMNFRASKIANNEWWNQSCRMWHYASACSEENLIMFCCRLVQLGWTGTGDGPAWLTESEHRKFVGESPSPHLTPDVVLHHWLYPWWILKLAFLLREGFILFSLKCLANLRPPSICGRKRKFKA